MSTGKISRKDFLKKSLRLLPGVLLAGTAGLSLTKIFIKEKVWQIDPYLCIQCGRCADSCVLSPSAVKCVHAYAMCGYCDLCSGYLRQGTRELSTAAENQLCPVSAIRRTFIEDPYYEYTIDESLCIGCGRCVKGCTAFGNGSLYLQIRHSLCMDCNECAIAVRCPSKAIRQIDADTGYILKGV